MKYLSEGASMAMCLTLLDTVVLAGEQDKDKGGKGYGQFQWRIGMLKPAMDR